MPILVLLPGFQRGSDIREQFWSKNGNFHRTRKNLKKGQNFTPFRINKMFSLKFLRHFRCLMEPITNKKILKSFFLKGRAPPGM
jgi:hypothetical protein